MIHEQLELAVSGSTGNNTEDSVRLPDSYRGLALEFEIEAVGATPTVTYKYQGSLDGTNWYDLGYITDASDTIATSTQVETAVGVYISFLSNPLARRYRFVRLVTSANTNVTYTARATPL